MGEWCTVISVAASRAQGHEGEWKRGPYSWTWDSIGQQYRLPLWKLNKFPSMFTVHVYPCFTPFAVIKVPYNPPVFHVCMQWMLADVLAFVIRQFCVYMGFTWGGSSSKLNRDHFWCLCTFLKHKIWAHLCYKLCKTTYLESLAGLPRTGPWCQSTYPGIFQCLGQMEEIRVKYCLLTLP